MHVQARASTTGSGFADDDGGSGSSISATYGAGRLSEILRLLEEAGFNIRSTSGSRIELGGVFGFAVDGRNEGEDHEAATHAASDLLNSQGIDTHVVDVETRVLEDVPGALRRFVNDVNAKGLLIEEIAVGTPEADGIPVQIYTAQVIAGG